MDGPSLLVVSGWAFPEPLLRPLLDALERIGPVRFIEPDPGRLDDLRREILSDGAPDRIVVGWSLGGMLALEALAAPKASAAGLVLVGSTPRFCSGPDFPHGADAARVRGLRLGLRRDPAGTLGRFYDDCAAPEAPLLSSSSRDRPGLDLLRRGLDYLLERDLRWLVARVEAPCVVVHGREDRVVPPAAGRWLAEAAARSRWVPVQGVGHDLPLRRPELLARIVGELGRRRP